MELADTKQDFATYRREVVRQSLERQAGVFTLVLSVALIVDAIRLHPSAAFARILERLPIQIATCAIAFAVLRSTELGRRWPTVVGTVTYALNGAFGGRLLGDLGGFDGPFFYASYVLPTFVMILPCALGERMLMTTAAVGAFLLAFFLPHPEHLDYRFSHIALAYLGAIVVTDLHFGHRGMSLLHERFRMARELAGRSEELAADNQRLEGRVREQTGSVRALLDRLDSSREQTRSAVARDLHDGMGQLVVGTRLELQQIERTLATGERLSTEHLGYLTGLVDHLERQVREMVRGLREPGVAGCLEDELDELVGAWPRSAGTEVSLLVRLEAEPSDLLRETIVAVAREALTNVTKHAAARRVSVGVGETDGVITLAIEDDGVGVDASGSGRSLRGGGFGVVGMRERVVLAGGEFALLPGIEGRGTTVRAAFPPRSAEAPAMPVEAT